MSVPLVSFAVADVSPARADRIAIGASVGVGGGESGTGQQLLTRGVLARLRLTDRLSIEGELGRAEIERPDILPAYCACDSRDWSALRFTAAARLDLARRTSALRPHLLAAVGVDRWSGPSFADHDYRRTELGGGIDLRLTDGLHLGGDVRGGRIDHVRSRMDEDVVIAIVPPAPFIDDQHGYVAARVTLSASF